jgi:putative ABC transport system permease protein
MVISVLERRGEIGLRRSLGATKGHIALQFLVESVLLTVLGGLLGVGLGIAVTVAWTRAQGWSLLIPWDVAVAALAGAAAVGALAGLYPAWRAARMDPADAVRPAA